MKHNPGWLGLSVLALTFDIGAADRETPPLNWYRCNTHTHTSAPPRSDANGSPEFVAQWYRSHGYQCLVITDHEYLTNVAPLNAKLGGGRFLILPGQEITQMVADPNHPGGVRHAHVNGINTNRLIMPIRPDGAAQKTGVLKFAEAGVSVGETLERNLAEIERAGGLAQINHPNLTWSVSLNDLLPIYTPFLLEIWNAFATSNNLGGVDGAGTASPSTEALWDALLSQGKIVWAWPRTMLTRTTHSTIARRLRRARAGSYCRRHP